jgi:hypothetical protein
VERIPNVPAESEMINRDWVATAALRLAEPRLTP